ncbi:MAG: hypothetical protein ACI9XB_002380 [Gammaproteobacteria bacterium]
MYIDTAQRPLTRKKQQESYAFLFDGKCNIKRIDDYKKTKAFAN